MRIFWGGGLCLLAIILALVGPALHVRSDDDTPGTIDGTDETKPPKSEGDSLVPAPDKRLTALHAEFIKKAEKLAGDYVRTKQPDRAVVVYEEILKLVPDEPRAKQQLDRLRQFEATAGRKVFEVQANRDWQDTGVRVIAGKPLKMTASGTWTLNLSADLGPDGLEMPKVLKDFKFGSLIGMVDDPAAKEPKYFAIGSAKDLTTDQSGPLLVRIHDPDPSDNHGALTLEITGRYDSK
ncbi:MAG TPA: hypothetical protein VHY91_12650 [Pirellulales bacterium]|nr:hypothetical protein [Pirellulales bacterium]